MTNATNLTTRQIKVEPFITNRHDKLDVIHSVIDDGDETERREQIYDALYRFFSRPDTIA